MAKQIKQKAYILRLWQEQNHTYYALINPHTGWRRSFSDISAFVDFLSQEKMSGSLVESDFAITPPPSVETDG